jgi:hypothetical protein
MLMVFVEEQISTNQQIDVLVELVLGSLDFQDEPLD